MSYELNYWSLTVDCCPIQPTANEQLPTQRRKGREVGYFPDNVSKFRKYAANYPPL
jgi:hypothetical protein